MGRYFEEFVVGEKSITEKRTITEADIMEFARLSGDDNRIHTDPEFSKTTPFGKQIAHGLLGMSIASGLAWQTGILGWNSDRIPRSEGMEVRQTRFYR